MKIIYFYRTPALTNTARTNLISSIREKIADKIIDLNTEFCFYINLTEDLTNEELKRLKWLLSETFEPENLSDRSFLNNRKTYESSLIVEVGPRMNFTTSWSTNAVSVCHACGIRKINRIERSRRYEIELDTGIETDSIEKIRAQFINLIHDRMTEQHYTERLTTFETGIKPEKTFTVPLLEDGRYALKSLNTEMGLGLDDWDIDYYYNLFVNLIGRNPTNVECFDLGQSNSEHSRHWFFKGRLFLNGREIEESLMDILSEPLRKNPANSIIAFKDNSSAIKGFNITAILPERIGEPSQFFLNKQDYNIIFTAETHNFPTGVAPFPGAETGTGGRIRDGHATGRGSLVVAGTAAYCVGNLNIPGYNLPWEDKSFKYPHNLASPLQIEIEASNGASDYGNKFGEPVIQGFTRSFGLRIHDRERIEWVKPIMFTGGVGQIDSLHLEKNEPGKGMLVVKIGGPAYRIGIGGRAASSMIQGENIEELDFSAVQRGDAEMEQKVNRVIRACVELREANPIMSIHDQGAGGNSNVVKEIIYPAGAKIEIRNILLGDNTLSVLEIWGAEYQENDALLIKSEHVELFSSLCKREKIPFSFIGEITGDGYIILHDSTDNTTHVNLELSKVLGRMPQKTFNLETKPSNLRPLELPEPSVKKVLERVLRLLSVGSKRFLTNKVDRSVTGLIAQQQCTGPFQLTLSNVAVIAQSHFSTTGAAISIGEQPIKGLINPSAMARMSVGEALTNILWAKVTALEDIKCSGNWMWAAKLPGEGTRLYEAAASLKDILIDLGIAIDGGKDSLSMATLIKDKNDSSELVKSPGTLVISAYVTCPDITKVLTPDIKRPGESSLIYIDIGKGRYCTGGSAVAHVFNQIGNESPDLDDSELLKMVFNTIQEFISDDLILSGHDRSDGGLIVTILEMAFGGNSGLDIQLDEKGKNPLSVLFSEELGLVVEYMPENEQTIIERLKVRDIPHKIIGRTLIDIEVKITLNGKEVLRDSMTDLRDIWEETSYRIDRLQATPECVEEERHVIKKRKPPPYHITFDPKQTSSEKMKNPAKPRVAIIREEGSNGDREMASAFYQASFSVWDVTITDLIDSRISLDKFNGVAFVGGFSYADILDSAKGWAGVIRFNSKVFEEFERFYSRKDTFSLGVCNGCQLMALLGWVPWKGIKDTSQPRFIHNDSGRFESRFSTVKIIKSPSIMLKDMEGSILGVWVAHGEGKSYFPEKIIVEEILNKALTPLRYVDDYGEITETYPFNPNGSPSGITALCSEDGRHLAMMPHPERTFLKWQWAWMPEEWRKSLKASPWLKMFQNARKWCESE